MFGQVGVQLGSDLLVQMATSFGFNEAIPFDLPLATSLMPDPEEMTTWETAWAACGEPVGEHESPAGPQATVLQMALVGSAIANEGAIMQPYPVSYTHLTKVYEAFKRVLNDRGRADNFIVGGYSRFLFLNRNGLPKVAVNFETMFRGLVKKYNKSHEEALPKVTTPHTLRHTFCTNLANAGMNPKALQYICLLYTSRCV